MSLLIIHQNWKHTRDVNKSTYFVVFLIIAPYPSSLELERFLSKPSYPHYNSCDIVILFDFPSAVIMTREDDFNVQLNKSANFSGYTPLHYASLVESYECVQLLLNAGGGNRELFLVFTSHSPLPNMSSDLPSVFYTKSQSKKFSSFLETTWLDGQSLGLGL